MILKKQLQKENKLRWLDVGCGKNREPGFDYLDILPVSKLSPAARKRYIHADIVNASSALIRKLGHYDLVRLQHTFEHLTPEDGLIALRNCAKLMRRGAYIVITTPDLKIHIRKYLNNQYKNWKVFSWWAHKRIVKNAPNSFYFSVFAHSLPHQPHKWCYDKEGLLYQLKRSGKFKKIRELKKSDPLASIPFTHNRPEEDVCVIANLK